METDDIDLEYEALLQRARHGCQQAQAQIIALCSKYVRSAVRRYMDSRVRSLFDSNDLMQDVWTPFFGGKRPLTSFDNIRHLRCYLQGIARKAVAQARRQLPPNDMLPLLEEQTLSETPVPDGVQGDPAPAVLIEDEWREFVRRERGFGHLLAMVREGLTTREIAFVLDTNVRAVQRLLSAARRRFDAFQRRTASR
jgi:DNA-directed RNA polymerase specialized sigma24 family protein